jgi:alpha-beta hydrolase superfamily lysophospholipase
LYFAQENLLFQFSKLHKDHSYKFKYPFEEINFQTSDEDVKINAIHFTVADSIQKGAVLFLHGNGGTVQGWGHEAKWFVENNYEVLFLEYRAYGKSGGEIESEDQIVADAQLAYDHLKEQFGESKIIISGTSMGTGVASQLAVKNNPKMLILNAPFYGLNQLIKQKIFLIPEMVIKYKFKTYEALPKLSCPIELFHGTSDRLIPISHSEKLKQLNVNCHLTYCNGGSHNGFSKTTDYSSRMQAILK